MMSRRMRRRKQTRRTKRKQMRQTKRRQMKKQGGSYKDLTTTTYLGIPISNKAVITVPGGVMSIKEYKAMIENKQEQGISAYEYI